MCRKTITQQFHPQKELKQLAMFLKETKKTGNNDSMAPMMMKLEGIKMQAKHPKDQIFSRGLPLSGAKVVLIECLNAEPNNNADITCISKIATPLLVPRTNSDTRNNNRRDAQGKEVPVNLE